LNGVEVGVVTTLAGFNVNAMSVDVAPDGNNAHSVQLPSVELPTESVAGKVPVAFQLPFVSVVWFEPKSVALGVQVTVVLLCVPQIWKALLVTFEASVSDQLFPT
jgi:hypothetical protein